MNNFSEFFRIDEHAHLVALVTHLAALFETRGDTINFAALVCEARRHNLVSEAVIASAASVLRSVSPLRSKVSILRSNLFAHRSASLSYKAAFELAAVTPFELRDLTDAGRKIANILLVARGQPTVAFTSFTNEHTKAMLHALGKCS